MGVKAGGKEASQPKELVESSLRKSTTGPWHSPRILHIKYRPRSSINLLSSFATLRFVQQQRGMNWRRKWQSTPVFLPGESQGWGNLVGCRLWGRIELDDLAAAAAAERHEYGKFRLKALIQVSRPRGQSCH